MCVIGDSSSTREIVDMSAGTVVKPAKQSWDSRCNFSDWKCEVRASGLGNSADRSWILRVLVHVYAIEEALVQEWQQRDRLRCWSGGEYLMSVRTKWFKSGSVGRMVAVMYQREVRWREQRGCGRAKGKRNKRICRRQREEKMLWRQ